MRATLVAGSMLAALGGVLIAVSSADTREAAESAVERAAFVEIERAAADIGGGRFSSLADLNAAYAYVVDGDGAVIAGATPDGPLPALDGGASQDASSAPRVARLGGLAHASKALRLADGRPVTLRLGLSLEPAWIAAHDIAIKCLFATLCFLALALPTLALAVDRVAAPLRELARSTVMPGAASEMVRAVGGRRDEVGALARAHLSITRDLAENADALHRLTFDDPLTSLPNRASLASRLAAALLLGQPAALLRIEVEGLSRVAAGLGQAHGDDAVRRAAERLAAVAAAWSDGSDLAQGDTVTLTRGSDAGFALLVQGADAAAARSLAEAALAAFEEPLQVGGHLVATSLSIGVALAPADGDETGALLRSAAAAVSASRAAGPQTVRFAGAELNRMAYGRLKLEQDLRRAIEDGELELHYQPQIALKTGALSGAEALVRWRHRIMGIIPPADFVPVAEDCGLIEPLGRVVLAQAARAAADWRARGIDLRVAVNISAIQFRRPDFAAATLKIIRDAGAEPADIELEITESAAMGDPAHAARELAPLKQAGVRIAIDDFGTGYSNLAALTRLPFDVLKIDRGFVKDAATEAGARVVVGAVIGLAEDLGFQTVAEGVETTEQLAFVTSQGVTHVQGYLFGKPMPAAAFEAWRAERLIANLRGVGSRGPAKAAVAAGDAARA